MTTSDPALTERIEREVRTLLDAAGEGLTRAERRDAATLGGLLRDPGALRATVTLADEVMRFRDPRRAARALARAALDASPRGVGLFDATGLRVAAALARVAPATVVGIARARVRQRTAGLVLDETTSTLARHLERRRAQGLEVNVNVVGEAVLGESQAADRLARVLAVIERPEVDYVSVKLSSVVPPLVTIDHDGSVERVSARLREIYRRAGVAHTFVNLDMEEYRDLRLTVDVFRAVLSEPEFATLEAGIVLQAYLPDSHDALDELIEWSRERHERHGSRIKVRLVKGANLAMERLEASLHGWVAAPYATKADVDASYARLVERSLRPENSAALRVGVASHNLFVTTWARELARERGVAGMLDIEMLEGMAPGEARALARAGTPVRLYAPVTRPDDFDAAVAYLVRRLDEGTAPENYLRAAPRLRDDPRVFAEERDRFVASLAARDGLSTARRRTADVAAPQQSDGDPTDPEHVARLRRALAEVRALADHVVGDDGVVGADGADWEMGSDPNDAGRPWYRYRVAHRDGVDAAVALARAAQPAWEARGEAGREEVLARAAARLADDRASLIAVMARDGGKTVGEADPEVSEAVDYLRFYGAHRAPGPSSPRGVVLVVPPWNFPLAIPAGGVAAGLAAGNAVILKPAPEAVATSWALVQSLWEAGVPRDVLQFVPTRDDEVGRALVTHAGVDAVILTGGFETARLFTSWRADLTLLAETSGKNALIVTGSADVDAAVRDLVQSAFGHAGQKCSAASLAIIDAATEANPRFWSQLSDAVSGLVVGDATELGTTVGPLIRPPEAALERALRLEAGESWVVEPRPLDDAGYRWRPGVKRGVAPGSWAHTHEWFGPVLGIMSAPDLATAIRWQNEIPFGLTGGVHSLDPDELETWIEGAEVGNAYVNRGVTGAIVGRQPFGGWRRSSVGPTAKAGGPHYVDALRDWPAVTDAPTALAQARTWWAAVGSRALDPTGLAGERNVRRYRRASRPIAVRVDDTLDGAAVAMLTGLVDLLGVTVEVSAAREVAGLVTRVESIDDLVARAGRLTRVRWLSAEEVPAQRLLDAGASVDRRPLAQSGAVEAPRWLLEQSVAITVTRYGALGLGPQPSCRGLGELVRR